MDKLAAEGFEDDEYLGKDMQFHRIRIRPAIDKANDDSDTESYMSEDVPDLDLEEIRANWDPSQGPRQLKRLKDKAKADEPN